MPFGLSYLVSCVLTKNSRFVAYVALHDQRGNPVQNTEKYPMTFFIA